MSEYSKALFLNGKLVAEVASADQLAAMKDGATCFTATADASPCTFQLAASTITDVSGTVTDAATLLASVGEIYFLM